jgi:hypothetical protein
MKKAASRRNDIEDDYDAPPPRDRNRRVHLEDDNFSDNESVDRKRSGRAGGDGRSSTRNVSVQEYDELSALCDRLLEQQQQLQSEIKSQASLIKVWCLSRSVESPIRN